MSTEDTDDLGKLLNRYREACPDIEASTNFMPNLWRRIDQRRSFAFIFQRFARTGMLAAAVLSLLLLILNVASPHSGAQTYTDALMADHSAEKTFYAEAIHSNTNPEAPMPELQH